VVHDRLCVIIDHMINLLTGTTRSAEHLLTKFTIKTIQCPCVVIKGTAMLEQLMCVEFSEVQTVTGQSNLHFSERNQVE